MPWESYLLAPNVAGAVAAVAVVVVGSILSTVSVDSVARW